MTPVRVARAAPRLAARIRIAAALVLCAGLAIAPPALGQALTSQPVLGMPATRVELIGTSPGEATGEAWAEGQLGAVPATIGGQSLSNNEALLRYTAASGTWQVVPLDDGQGSQIPFTWNASEVTSNGGVVLVGSDNGSGHKTIVTRDPGGQFTEAAPPPPTVLLPGETLYPASGVPVMTAFDEGGGTGVLIAPRSKKASPGVLHYLNGTWTRETVCSLVTGANDCVPISRKLTPVALSGSSPSNAWLLAGVGAGSSARLHLFERESGVGGAEVWVSQTPSSWLLRTGAAPPGTPPGETSSLPRSGAVLSAAGSGVWLDLSVTSSGPSGSASLFIVGGSVVNTWCYPTSLCPGSPSLGGTFPDGYGSIAWAGQSPTNPGARIITGLPQAAVLLFSGGGGSFSHDSTGGTAAGGAGGGGTFGPGGETLTATGAAGGGAAFASLSEGWIGVPPSGLSSAVQVLHVTGSPSPDALTGWPVPFRQPLLAIATAPGSTPGDPSAHALAVGVGGEIARYTPGAGWVPEFLYNRAGAVQTPTLRGVAWPTSERAFAVGDNGAMWVWRSETGLWEPDPAEPLNFHANLTAIAFSPSDPDIGYAVGKQGVLLAYGKTWTQQSVPAAVAQANFTSVAFAGNDAIVSYRLIDPADPSVEEGGILINNGSGWAIDQSAASLLGTLPSRQTVISKVSGLPGGGAVAAGPGVVLERDSASSGWRFSAQPLADSDSGNISAVAAVQNGSSVSALVSVDDDPESGPSNTQSNDNINWLNIDNPPAVAAGQPPLLIGPDPLPSRGFLLRETPTGWQDLESQDYPNLLFGGSGGSSFDLPGWPDPVLALDVSPSGDQGWAVGGQTGGPELEFGNDPSAAGVVNTAGVLHLGPGPSPPTGTSAPIPIPSGQVTFALAGGSGCDAACADNAAQNLGPDAWLSAAINRANAVGGLRAFLYAGQRNAQVGFGGLGGGADAFDRELARYDEVLSSGGSLPVYAAAAPNDVSGSAGGPSAFAQILGAHVPAGSVPAGSPSPPAGTAAYAFDSSGTGGTVRVIVLDYSAGSLGSAQLAWLASQLDSAQRAAIPAIVLGSEDITDGSAPNAAGDGAQVQQVLLAHGASAYLFYDAAQQNVAERIGSGASSIPAYGSGTLGYVAPPSNFAAAQAFLGASGFLLVSVNAGARNPATNRAPISVSLIPNTGQLALDPTDGTLLRRSQVALFQGLARRPLGGGEFEGSLDGEGPDPYTVLPATCLGGACAEFIKPAYAFTSSNPAIGNFVEHDPTSTNPRQILQSSSGKPIPDPTSGLFCAFNAGTTTVTIKAGGLSYSMPVTVQAGSVQEPCGTVSLRAAETTPAPAPAPPPPAPAPSPGSAPAIPVGVPPPPAGLAPPLPAPSLPVLTSAPPVLGAIAIPPRLILPLATFTARPIPPIGFGTVPAIAPLPVRVLEEQKDEEEAVEHAQSNFAAYHQGDPSPVVPGIALIVLVLAAGAGAAAMRDRRRLRGRPAFVRSEVDRYRR